MNNKFRITPQLILNFVTLVETSSITASANQLHITPTAVSRQLKQLESEIKQPLFVRTTRKMTLTDFGERFYHACLHMKTAYENTLELAGTLQAKPHGTLKIVCASYFADTYLFAHLKKFHQLYPEVDYQIEIADRIPDMHREKIDILIGFSQFYSPSHELRSKKIVSTHYLLCAAPSYLKKYGTPKNEKELLTHQFINHSLRKEASVLKLANHKSLKINKPFLIVNSISAIIQLCVDGMGIALLAESVAQNYLKQKKLVPLLTQLNWPKLDIYAYYHFSTYEQPKVRAFVDLLG